MCNANGVTTPMPSSYKLSKHDVSPLFDRYQYTSMVRALQYITFTKPNITLSVNKSFNLWHPLLSPTGQQSRGFCVT